MRTRRRGAEGSGTTCARSSQGGHPCRADSAGLEPLLHPCVQVTFPRSLVARLPYAKNSFEFKPQFKVWVAANHKPIVRGDDLAIWRRIHLISFERKFEGKAQDKGLKQKLLAELPGILNWAIEGCLLWQKQGLVQPPQIREATQEYRDEMDLLAEWMESRCIQGPDKVETVTNLYRDYDTWCLVNGVRAMERRVFGRKLKSRGFQGVKSGGQRGYRGICLAPHRDHPHSLVAS